MINDRFILYNPTSFSIIRPLSSGLFHTVLCFVAASSCLSVGGGDEDKLIFFKPVIGVFIMWYVAVGVLCGMISGWCV